MASAGWATTFRAHPATTPTEPHTSPPSTTPTRRPHRVRSAEVDQLHPADVDRALSSNAGHDWRRMDFQIDVEIQGQSYHVVHSTGAPGELEIDGHAMYSDVWG